MLELDAGVEDGCHSVRARSIACAVDENSARRTANFDEEEEEEEEDDWSSSDLSGRRVDSRWIMGQRVVDIPRRVSTFDRGEVVGAPRGERGRRWEADGGLERGEVPFERAVITS